MSRARAERGFALLIVLWTLVLVTLLVTQLMSSGRSETQLAGNLRQSAKLEAMVDGAVQQVIFQALAGVPGGWQADGLPHRVPLGGGTAMVRVTDQAGLVNPSTAAPEVMQALLRQLGVDSAAAASLAQAIVVWRTPSGQVGTGGARFDAYRAAGLAYGPSGAPFLSMDEVGAVIGMTPALLQRLAPHLTLYTDGDPGLATTDPVVKAALQSLGGQAPAPLPPDATRVLAIAATVDDASGASFTRRVIVRLSPASAAADFRIVAWAS